MNKQVLRMNEKRTFGQMLSSMGNTLSLLIALIILGVVWSFMTPYFLTPKNIVSHPSIFQFLLQFI